MQISFHFIPLSGINNKRRVFVSLRFCLLILCFIDVVFYSNIFIAFHVYTVIYFEDCPLRWYGSNRTLLPYHAYPTVPSVRTSAVPYLHSVEVEIRSGLVTRVSFSVCSVFSIGYLIINCYSLDVRMKMNNSTSILGIVSISSSSLFFF